MTKSKSQLRAEAVERLRGLNCMDVDCYQLLEATVDDAGEKVGYRVEISKLIDLLTDDAHESRGSYEERLYDVPVSDCPYCGCKRVVIHDFSDIYEDPHSYRVEHVDEKEAFETGCFETYYAFDSVEKAVEHANMRDTLTDEQTNGIEGETNGIADGSPLVDRDPVEIMRNCGSMKQGMGSLRKILGIECVTGWQMWCLSKLADMVERDYVSHQDFAAQHRTLCGVRGQRDEAREQVDAMRDVIRDFRDERDGWKTKFETRELAYKQADAERKRYSEQIDALIAERDEWKAKAEGSSNVRASDLLTDDETCPNSDGTCPDADGTPSIEQGGGVAKLDAQARAEIEDAERSAKAAETAQGCVDDEIVYGFQFCDAPSSTMLGETVFDSDGEPIGWIVANGLKGDFGHDADMSDSREKLEADVRVWKDSVCSFSDDELYAKVAEWLDRQAAITRAECDKPNWDYCETCEQLKAMQDKIDELEAALKGERNNFYQAMESRKHWQREYENLKVASETYRDGMHAQARRVGEVKAERDRYREKLGRALDAAYEIARMVDES